MIDRVMPTRLKKRRIVFIEDSLWLKIENISQELKISKSEALRRILKNKLFIFVHKTQIPPPVKCLHNYLHIKFLKRDFIFYPYIFIEFMEDDSGKTQKIP